MSLQESPFKADVLSGSVVLVTGGSSGIGLEISRQLGTASPLVIHATFGFILEYNSKLCYPNNYMLDTF